MNEYRMTLTLKTDYSIEALKAVLDQLQLEVESEISDARISGATLWWCCDDDEDTPVTSFTTTMGGEGGG